MATTTHLGITLVEQAQAQKEITVNSAFYRLDAVLNTGAISRTLATPPVSPAAGDVYIIAASPTDEWAGKAGQIAYFNDIWRFIIPREGMNLWVNNEDVSYLFDGASWQSQAIHSYQTLAGTAHTLDTSSIEKTVAFTNAAAVTFTLPNDIYVGFRCRVVQAGAGQVSFTPASGATRRNRQSHTKTAGQWAVCALEIISNSDGNSAEYLLSGDGAV